MAAAYIPFDHGVNPVQIICIGIQQVLDGITKIGRGRAVMIQTCDGPTNVAANWDLLATLNGFQAGDYGSANEATMALFAEIDSLYAKLTAGAGVGDATGAAIAQAAGKLGVV